MNDKHLELATEPIPKLLLRYSIPAIISMLVATLYNVIDRIFIGNIPEVGTLSMAGLGITLPIVSIINAFGMLLAVGGATTIALRQGEGLHHELDKILGNVFSLTIIFGIIITGFSLTFSTEILTLFGASSTSLPYAQEYLDIILLGATFSLFGSVFSYLIRGDGSPRFSAILMITGCVLNIILDALFIYLFGLGIKGAAIATVISQLATTVIGLYYYLSGHSHIKFKALNLRIRWTYIKSIIAIGLAPFATQLASSLVQVLANTQLATYGGDLAVGAMATIMSAMMIFGMPIVGITTGSQPIISYNYGAKEYKRVEATMRLSFAVVTGILAVGWVCVMLFPTQIVSIFNSDVDLLAVTVDGMRKTLLTFPLLGISYVGTNFIQSTGNAKLAVILGLLRQAIFLGPLFYILPQYMGLDGVWYAQPVADVLSAGVNLTAIFYTIRGYKKK